MAKKVIPATDSSGAEVVEELHVADGGVDYTEITGKNDLPAGVADPATEEEEDEPQAKPAKAAPVEDEVPDELKGKTPAQLAKMYRDAQSVIGRQGNELGDLRRTADAYIKARLQADAKPPVAPSVPVKTPDAVDFFTNPTDSVAKLIAASPALKELQDAKRESFAREIQRNREENTRQFNAAHPDAAEVLADQGFRDWVTKSPVRQAMLVRAHQHYDLAAANEVFNTWKELKAARAPVVDPTKPKPKPVATKEAARAPTGGNASPRTSGGSGKEGKIFRRADVIRLMEQDPDRYAMMADEITQAYTEGRVR